MDRRGFLKGALAALLPPAWTRQVRGTAKHVVWLWMGGGMSQVDSWDPKPGIKGSPFKPIDTAVEGIQVSELLPLCARQMKHLAIIRSMSTVEKNRERATFLMHTGVPLIPGIPHPAVGAVIAWELGRMDASLPRFIAIDPPAIPQSPLFGDDFLPYVLAPGTEPLRHLRSSLAAERAKGREALLVEQSAEWESGHVQKEVARLWSAADRARALPDSPFLKAFALDEEPAALREEYGGGFGARCLLARRLVQAGCPFVEVGLDGWDLPDAVMSLGPRLDAGLGTLVKDLAEKKLLQETLVVCLGEFGWSPGMNAAGGRDVNATGWSVVLAGGGIRGGQVYGETGADGSKILKPVGANRLMATIYAACGINGERRMGIGHCVDRYTYPFTSPIRELL